MAQKKEVVKAVESTANNASTTSVVPSTVSAIVAPMTSADCDLIIANLEKETDLEKFNSGVVTAINALTANIADALGMTRGVFFKLSRLTMVRALQNQNITVCQRFIDTFIGKDADSHVKSLFGTYANRVLAFYRNEVYAKDKEGKPSKYNVISKASIDRLVRDFSSRNLDNPKDWKWSSVKPLAIKRIADDMGNPSTNSALTGIISLVRSLVDKDKDRDDLSAEDCQCLDGIRSALAWIEKCRETDSQLTINPALENK